MKKLVIIYGTSLKQVQGINYVNDSFVRGKSYFMENGIDFVAIVSNEEIFWCKDHDHLDTIGSNIQDSGYKRTRRFRTFVKRYLSADLLLWALPRTWELLHNYKKATLRYLNSGINADYILFQGIKEAYYFYKLKKGPDTPKMVVMNHGEGDPYAQLRNDLKGVFRYPLLVKWFFTNKDKFVYERIDKISFLSQKAVNAAAYVPMIKKTYIFNGIEDLPNIVLKQSPTDIIEFICVGSMNWWKGQDIIVQALLLLSEDVKRNVHVNFVGTGPQESEIKAFVEEHKLENYVRFWGVRNDVSSILEQMDVFMLPSKAEGMPMSMIEAERQGLYIIATNVGGIAEITEDTFRTLVERNPQSLANAITDIVINKKITLDVRKASRSFYERNLMLKTNIYKYSELFNSL